MPNFVLDTETVFRDALQSKRPLFYKSRISRTLTVNFDGEKGFARKCATSAGSQ